ncbi:esterase-like activity of phytase family protein [Pelagibacterium flavum]|uniref:Esterase-like activity of phytase family protein n=1 Tax=Pelagibacterium flavum TaxID=2984530 RepID=A0ABY6ITP9_9HYPH|nr:esterase-like activity of phytase family protein [Pelagibacterium sp. YIM 151497]UYQ72804.1 esterase-like activity of phytase family protein [Pelagibacterium sp. YIM 151497]
MLTITLGLAAASASAQSPSVEAIEVSSRPIASFRNAAIGEPVGSLIFEGGLEVTSAHPDFGGISGLAFIDATRFVMVTDQGRFLSGALELADGAPAGLSNVEIDIVRNSSGNPLPNKFSSDSEAIEVVIRNNQPAAVRVGFENLSRIADFNLSDGRPSGPAREIAIPQWLTDLRTNESIESVCIAPPASPIAGSTLIIAEGHQHVSGQWAATLLGNRDRGNLGLAVAPGVNPTDCAFLPDGDLLVLERGLAFLAFSIQIRLIPAAEIRPGATMVGEVILSGSGSAVDNFEGLGVRTLPDGQTRVTIVSDNNFNSFQRTLLLEFSFPD